MTARDELNFARANDESGVTFKNFSTGSLAEHTFSRWKLLEQADLIANHGRRSDGTLPSGAVPIATPQAFHVSTAPTAPRRAVTGTGSILSSLRRKELPPMGKHPTAAATPTGTTASAPAEAAAAATESKIAAPQAGKSAALPQQALNLTALPRQDRTQEGRKRNSLLGMIRGPDYKERPKRSKNNEAAQAQAAPGGTAAVKAAPGTADPDSPRKDFASLFHTGAAGSARSAYESEETLESVFSRLEQCQ